MLWKRDLLCVKLAFSWCGQPVSYGLSVNGQILAWILMVGCLWPLAQQCSTECWGTHVLLHKLYILSINSTYTHTHTHIKFKHREVQKCILVNSKQTTLSKNHNDVLHLYMLCYFLCYSYFTPIELQSGLHGKIHYNCFRCKTFLSHYWEFLYLFSPRTKQTSLQEPGKSFSDKSQVNPTKLFWFVKLKWSHARW